MNNFSFQLFQRHVLPCPGWDLKIVSLFFLVFPSSVSGLFLIYASWLVIIWKPKGLWETILWTSFSLALHLLPLLSHLLSLSSAISSPGFRRDYTSHLGLPGFPGLSLHFRHILPEFPLLIPQARNSTQAVKADNHRALSIFQGSLSFVAWLFFLFNFFSGKSISLVLLLHVDWK